MFAQIWHTKTRDELNQFEGSWERLFSVPPIIGITGGGWRQIRARRSAGFDLAWEFDTELTCVCGKSVNSFAVFAHFGATTLDPILTVNLRWRNTLNCPARTRESGRSMQLQKSVSDGINLTFCGLPCKLLLVRFPTAELYARSSQTPQYISKTIRMHPQSLRAPRNPQSQKSISWSLQLAS